jgi:uncharacterized cupredoxin-like copper-binding protein
METRARSRFGLVVVPLVAALALAACASAAGPGWTYVPPAATQQAVAAAASGAPGASGAPAASAPAGGSASGAPSASVAPSASGAAAGGTAANEIDLVETSSLQITNPAGQVVSTITVQKGQTYHFRITNTAGFVHNFYVGKVSDLEAGNIASLTGTGDFTSGTKEFDYTFSDTSAPLGFGCMVPGHYQAGMKGTFTIQ